MFLPASLNEPNTARAEYNVWRGMLHRCYNDNITKYDTYGAQGIDVCDEWFDFITFAVWLRSNGWAIGLHVDRINPELGYSPENCRILTAEENQTRGKRSPKDSLTGVKGITFYVDRKAFMVRVAGYKQATNAERYGGCYETFREAEKALSITLSALKDKYGDQYGEIESDFS